MVLTARISLCGAAGCADYARLPSPPSVMKPQLSALLLLLAGLGSLGAAEPPPATFRPQTIDDQIRIGYGVAIADVDGDGRADVLVADAKQIVWYRNPSWEKFVMAENLTPRDHVCLAARDIDGDGKAEVAVGAGWNPGDTVGSGAVFYLVAPEDRTARWRPVRLPHEPTTHRMAWMRDEDGAFALAVQPLHGRGNRNNAGEGVRFLGYRRPRNIEQPWPAFELNAAFHATHNFDLVRWQDGSLQEDVLLASLEGVHWLRSGGRDQWTSTRLTTTAAGEVRGGRLPGGGRFVAAVEPMHGNQLAVYRAPAAGSAAGDWSASRVVLDDSLAQAHGLGTGDFLGVGYDQIVVGWRGGVPAPPGTKVGLKLYTPSGPAGDSWTLNALIDDNTMACEDLKIADLNGDGRPDIIAAGRATKNVIIYWNETPPADTSGLPPAAATETWLPEPPIVTAAPGAAPSDALVLFGGRTLAAWESVRGGGPAPWKLEGDAMVVDPKSGNIRTKAAFGDIQLHLEFRTPAVVSGTSQGRGNSGVFFMGLYELQILDSYENKTYVNGQNASIYKQHAPLVNASRGPGQWQSFDVIFVAPRFATDGRILSPARMTVLHNGVLVHHNVELQGGTTFRGAPVYKAHAAKLPLQLQDHRDLNAFRNIWVRELSLPGAP